MIVITGAAGFIGSVLLWKFNLLGEQNIIAVDQNAQEPAKAANLKNLKFKEYLESDVFLKKLEQGAWNGQIKAIFHMGACSSTTEMNVAYLKENNTGYSERIAKWCLAHNAYLSYASSAATYGNGELGYSDKDELTPRLKPLNPYGQSKLDFDIWVLKNKLQDKVTGFRFFNVYGPNEYHKGEMRSMVHKGFGQVQSTGKMRLFKSYKKEYSDGGQQRDFVYVKDVVDVMIWFTQHQDKKGIFNLGAGKAESWNDLAAALFASLGKKPVIEYIEMPDSIKNQYQYFTQADLTKLRQAGCNLTFKNLKEGVQDYTRHLLSPNPYL